MASLSSAALVTVETFAGAMGLPARAAADGSYAFRFARSGTLSITPASDDRVVMSLAWMPERRDASGPRQLLAAASHDPATGRYLHTGMAPDGSFVAAVNLDQRHLDLPTLDQWLRRLLDLRSAFG
jgi:type III secretion system chaperone SycN